LNTAIDIFSEKGLEAIESCNFLTESDSSSLMEMRQELQENFELTPKWRNETLARVSVLNDIKHPTNASKFWQCRAEQKNYFEELVRTSFEYRRNSIKMQRLHREIEAEDDDLREAELKIDLEECLFRRQQMENDAKYRVGELKMWSKLKTELDDGSFDVEDAEKSQLVSTTNQSMNRLASATLPGCQLTPDEAKNIIGLCKTSLKRCEEVGIFEEIIASRDSKELDRIMPIIGYSPGIKEVV